MLRDKDISGVIEAVKGRIDVWLPCTLEGPRAASADFLAEALEAAGCKVGGRYPTPLQALQQAQACAGEDDRILAFGSFLTVAEVLRARAPKR
jgi:dihydrofolate synthase/folylpolyglutamate synthase